MVGAYAREVQLSRITRALKALVTPDEQMATVSTSPRDGRGIGPYQSPNVDQPISASRAPPGARQVWQLYRVREACRDLELRSPLIGGYARWIVIQAVGTEPATLVFDRLTREQHARLEAPSAWLRNGWRRHQTIPGIGGTGRSIHQMAGSVLHHVVIDGDCFLTEARGAGPAHMGLVPGRRAQRGAVAEPGSASGAGGEQLDSRDRSRRL